MHVMFHAQRMVSACVPWEAHPLCVHLGVTLPQVLSRGSDDLLKMSLSFVVMLVRQPCPQPADTVAPFTLTSFFLVDVTVLTRRGHEGGAEMYRKYAPPPLSFSKNLGLLLENLLEYLLATKTHFFLCKPLFFIMG